MFDDTEQEGGTVVTGLLDSFAGWVREVALMLLLVGLAELLLPDSGLQRYARFVFGLVLLLVLLGPILPFADLSERMQAMQSEAVWSPSDTDVPSLGSRGDETSTAVLANTGQELGLDLQRNTVTTWLVRLLEAMPGVERAEVEIELEKDTAANDYGAVQAVRAMLFVHPDAEGDGTARTPRAAIDSPTDNSSPNGIGTDTQFDVRRVKPVERIRFSSAESDALRDVDATAWERKARQRLREALGLPDELLYVEVRGS